MGKLNVAKMANFMEVDCYVLVSCPENSLIDSKVCIGRREKRKKEKNKDLFTDHLRAGVLPPNCNTI